MQRRLTIALMRGSHRIHTNMLSTPTQVWERADHCEDLNWFADRLAAARRLADEARLTAVIVVQGG
jgi:hypothetical protein